MMFDFVDAFVSARFPQQSAIKIDERVRRLALSIDAVNSVSLAGCIHLISCNGILFLALNVISIFNSLINM